jgi:hypothetical protein
MKLKFALFQIAILFFAFGNSNAQKPDLVLCKGSTINYRENNIGSSLPSVSWFWTFQGATPAASTARNPQNINYPNAGLFKTSCTSTFTDSSKQTNDIYVLIIDGSFSNIPIRDTIICNNTISLTLDAGNNSPINQFIWSSPDAPVTAKDTFNKLTINQAGTYSVKITNICGTSTKTITVKKGTMPTVNLGGDLFVCRNISLILDAGFVPGYTYSWTPTLETTAQITASIAGNYKVTVTSSDGCSKTDDINLKDSCPPVVWLPNAFTPNDADPNNIYKPYLEGFKSLRMFIYNRWGQKMFETTDLNGGWDGFYLGDPAVEGVYICLLELVGNDSYRKMLKTNFHLLR